MRKTTFVVLVALAILAAAACTNSPTSPSANSPVLAGAEVKGPATTDIKIEDFVGTWQATKAEACRVVAEGGGFVEVVGSRRDLVAEGGTVTLVLEGGQMDNPANWPRYTITVIMPGVKTGVDAGRWVYTEFHDGRPQIDFYPSSLGPDPEYGWIPAFLVALSDNTLTLWDSGLTFLPFDFGWGTTPGMTGTVLNLVFTRK